MFQKLGFKIYLENVLFTDKSYCNSEVMFWFVFYSYIHIVEKGGRPSKIEGKFNFKVTLR